MLFAYHARIGTRRGRRSLGCFAQAVLLLRFMRQRAAIADLARDNTISLSSAYRYLHEALDVLAAQAPELPEVVADAVHSGTEHFLLDGTLIPTDRVHDRTGQGDRWYSGKHRHHGGLVQVITDPDGRPLWVSPVEPGCTHDLTAARVHALPLLYLAAGHGVPTLADKA
ncbi:transposase family protein [Kineococcus sp. SYSU DK018]|uniref:transposase family protein n=1 Tax=Kineococcus sp. SYSU DK018 TaxID=3383139 RepID=UPI003D7CCE1B